MSKRPKVVYWNHSPTPYFVERFNAVIERGGLDFEAWFNDRREPMRSWEVNELQWHFPARYIPRRSLLGWAERVPVAELRAARPDLLVQEYDRAHLIAGFLAARRLAGRTAFRVLPNFDSWSARTWWREAAKQFAFRAVDAAKVPGNQGAALAERYGLPPARIGNVTQSVDVARFGRGRRGGDWRAQRREELGLAGCVFIYSGRLWAGKGTDVLLDAYELVRSAGKDVSLLLLGDGPDERRYRARATQLRGVVFAGFIQVEEIAAYYGLADVMVFPTLGDPHGLVIEEAMAASLPVICSSAAGDIATRLPDPEAGYIVPPNDAPALAQRMLTLADDAQLRISIGKRAAELARARTHAHYAADFEAFVTATLSRPPRRSWAAAGARLAGAAISASARHQTPAALITAGRSAGPIPQPPLAATL